MAYHQQLDWIKQDVKSVSKSKPTIIGAVDLVERLIQMLKRKFACIKYATKQNQHKGFN